MSAFDLHHLQSICTEFSLGDLLRIEQRLGGFANINLKIQTSKGFFVIRILLEETETSRLKYAYGIISKLSSNGIPALTPISTKKGNSFSVLNGRLVQVTPFIEGFPFSGTPEQAQNNGRILARIHQLLESVHETLSPNGVYSFLHLDPDSIVKGLQSQGHVLPNHNWGDIKDFYQWLCQESYEPEGMPLTIIHGDWNPWNQLYTKNGEINAVMDFDTLQRGERIFDIAYTLFFYLREQRLKALGKWFMQGYGPLTVQEIENLPFLIAKIGLFFGIFTDIGKFSFNRNRPFLEWILSEEGKKFIREACHIEK